VREIWLIGEPGATLGVVEHKSEIYGPTADTIRTARFSPHQIQIQQPNVYVGDVELACQVQTFG